MLLKVSFLSALCGWLCFVVAVPRSVRDAEKPRRAGRKEGTCERPKMEVKRKPVVCFERSWVPMQWVFARGESECVHV